MQGQTLCQNTLLFPLHLSYRLQLGSNLYGVQEGANYTLTLISAHNYLYFVQQLIYILNFCPEYICTMRTDMHGRPNTHCKDKRVVLSHLGLSQLWLQLSRLHYYGMCVSLQCATNPHPVN